MKNLLILISVMIGCSSAPANIESDEAPRCFADPLKRPICETPQGKCPLRDTECLANADPDFNLCLECAAFLQGIPTYNNFNNDGASLSVFTQGGQLRDDLAWVPDNDSKEMIPGTTYDPIQFNLNQQFVESDCPGDGIVSAYPNPPTSYCLIVTQ
jgi:hypothetical protein